MEVGTGGVGPNSLQLPKSTWDYIKLLQTFKTDTVNLPVLLATLLKRNNIAKSDRKLAHTIYMRLYRKMKQLHNDGIVEVYKGDDGLIWIKKTAVFFDLIKAGEKFKRVKKEKNNPYALPSRARPERISSIKICLSTKMLNKQDAEKIKDLFQYYLQDAEDRIIVLRERKTVISEGDTFLLKQYNTRFTNSAHKARNLIIYDNVVSTSLDRYKKGVFLTLTTDPSRHKSLWHADRHLTIAWNRFMSFLTSRIYRNHPRRKHILEAYKEGKITKEEKQQQLKELRKECRPRYLAVYEFTESGLIHVHALIFGRSYLLGKDEITKEWERCNQGTINFIYSIRNDNGKWVWSKEKPSDSKKGETATDYLKKYLKKAQYYEEDLFMYWVINKRFFTYSRVLRTVEFEKKVTLGIFIFFGSWRWNEIPGFVLETGIKTWIDKPPP